MAAAWTEQGRNIEAIARFFGAQTPRTGAAVAARDEWLRFYSALGDFEANFEQQAYDRSRNLKLQYNRANAITAEERAAVEEQALRGVSSEDIAGEPDRRTSTGEYVPPPSGSATLGRVALAAGLGALLLWKVRS